jgi:hypothetical protein
VLQEHWLSEKRKTKVRLYYPGQRIRPDDARAAGLLDPDCPDPLILPPISDDHYRPPEDRPDLPS